MRRGGRRVDTYYGRAMLEIRPTLFLSVRLAVRANQVLLSSGAAVNGAHLWLAALPGFVILDLVVWRILRRDDRFGLAWRLPLDAADAAFWAMSPSPGSGRYDWAVIIAIPLAMEAGVRLGWRGLVVPLTVFASSGAAAVAVGRALEPGATVSTVVAVGVGAAFYRYCRHLDERAEGQRQATATAARRRAYMAGQHHVAMGASSAVDALEGLVPVLGRPEPGSALWQVADGWKAQLGGATGNEARYLQIALLEWEQAHNRHPDLSGLVEIRLPEGHGTTLLSARQAQRLEAALDAMTLRGIVPVRLADPGAPSLPGRELHLQVGGRRLVIPGDGRPSPPPFDPTIVGYAYVAVLLANDGFAALGGLRLWAVAVTTSICAGAAAVSYRRVARAGERAQLGGFWIAAAASLALTVVASQLRRPVTADGDVLLGFSNSVLLVSFVAGSYPRALASRPWAFPATLAANVVLGIAVFPVASVVTLRAVGAAFVYNLCPYFPCRHLAATLERSSASHAEALRALDEHDEQAAFLEGQEAVVGLVRQARDDAVRQLELLAPRLEGSIFALATHRIEEVDRRLDVIAPSPGS